MLKPLIIMTQFINIHYANEFFRKDGNMYHIAILANNQKLGRQIFDCTEDFCTKHGLFPQITLYGNPEDLFIAVKECRPKGVIIALNGIDGLNASEHLRSIYPECKLIWCSDVDFSLQAYRLRAEYFIKCPFTNEDLCEGLFLWIKNRYLHHRILKTCVT